MYESYIIEADTVITGRGINFKLCKEMRLYSILYTLL